MTSRPLRIAVIAPVAVPVLPDSGHSIEQLVSLLTEELVARGHAVTLFATGNSRTSAQLDFRYERGYSEDDELWDWQLHEVMNAGAALERADDFDVIHSHAYHAALPFTRFVRTPVLHTYHIEIDPDVLRVFQQLPDARLLAISDSQRSGMTSAGPIPVVRHGIDVDAFEFRAEHGGYLLFLGQVIERKGPLEAIRIAKEVGMPLVIAGPAGEYAEYAIRPHVDDERVRYVGAVDPARRNGLLAGAAALLYPIAAAEPFGLVMIEAMASGTPVVATSVGAVPEIVDVGATGVHAEGADALAAAVPAALDLDRRRVRAAAARRWSHRRMVDEYESIYERVAAEREMQLS